MRTLEIHKTNPANERIAIAVVDERGPGNANHEYELTWPGCTTSVGDAPSPGSLEIHFQNGPIAEVGVNGVTNEALLAVLIDRMEGFQSGPYHCEENARILLHLQAALAVAHERTKARMGRGVEGTMSI